MSLVRLATGCAFSGPEAMSTPTEGMATAAWPVVGQGRLTEPDCTSTVRSSTEVTAGAGSGALSRTAAKRPAAASEQHQHEQDDEPAPAAPPADAGATRPRAVRAVTVAWWRRRWWQPAVPASARRNDSRVNGATMRGDAPSSLTSR